MESPSLGQLHLARQLLRTEMTAPRRRKPATPPIFYRIGETAVVLTFVFFMFM
jgi:hypothetical protein